MALGGGAVPSEASHQRRSAILKAAYFFQNIVCYNVWSGECMLKIFKLVGISINIAYYHTRPPIARAITNIFIVCVAPE